MFCLFFFFVNAKSWKRIMFCRLSNATQSRFDEQISMQTFICSRLWNVRLSLRHNIIHRLDKCPCPWQQSNVNRSRGAKPSRSYSRSCPSFPPCPNARRWSSYSRFTFFFFFFRTVWPAVYVTCTRFDVSAGNSNCDVVR